MLDGPSVPEMTTSFSSPIIEAPQGKKDFTPLPRNYYENSIPPLHFEEPTLTEPPSYSGESISKMPQESQDLPEDFQKIIDEIKAENTAKKNPEQKLNNPPVKQEEIKKNFFARAWEAIKKLFPWNWGKS